MNAPSPEAEPAPRLAGLATDTIVSDRDAMVDLSHYGRGAALGGASAAVVGKSVLVSVGAQTEAAVAMIELDGLVGSLVLAPPDIDEEGMRAVIEDAAVDYVLTDRPERFAAPAGVGVIRLRLDAETTGPAIERRHDSRWILLTSGTSGRPKMVAHSLAALTGAIPPRRTADARAVWSTFYDIRRYGGLQIFLRAVVGGANIVLSSPGETLTDHLRRLGAAGVTAISGTPSHWRRVLMTPDRGAFSPAYIRLSGEIADQMALDALHSAFPGAAIGHAYASTEAGVAFAVDDCREGFPAALIERSANGVEMRVIDGALQIRSSRTASCYIGPNAPVLKDAEGFVDTGDLVERRGDRYMFVGRRGGIVNVGGLKVNPEEVEAVINRHPVVSMSLVSGKKNPVTGALVVADVVLREGATAGDALKQEIFDMCHSALDRHKAPTAVRFVESLPLTPGGKLRRDPASTGVRGDA